MYQLRYDMRGECLRCFLMTTNQVELQVARLMSITQDMVS